MKTPAYFTILIGLALFISCQQNQTSDSPIEGTLSQGELVEKGEYLSKTIGCDHCHTPKKMTDHGPVPDSSRWLMGHPADVPMPEVPMDVVQGGSWGLMNHMMTIAVGPWGASFAANLTPHQTGIGNWTYDQFKIAMTKGKYKGIENSRTLLPPMPWESYQNMKEEDLKAIFEYLKSIEPIDNLVPNAIPPGELQ